ncbi:MAG: hypothetical protein HYS07_06775 [Chlamydiae bacterium]|nr:hypothetical protein [Chlamydiota bacterium]MBI3276382.1 hypothetical protein [Chlamydiota bacterium]
MKFSLTLLVFSLIINLAGCQKVSYPKLSLESSFQEILKEEYALDAEAKLQGKTLGISAHFKKLWGEDGLVDKKIWSNIGKIKFVATRVLLSSDANVDFIRYRITGEDSREELDYIRTFQDEKLLQYEGISVNEYWSREVLIRRTYEGKEPQLEEVKWEDFLVHLISKQIREKYQTVFKKNSQGAQGPQRDIDRFWGMYFPKEDPENQLGENLFALVIEAKKDPESLDWLKETIQETVKKVCHTYKKFPFEHLRILNVSTKTIFEVNG